MWAVWADLGGRGGFALVTAPSAVPWLFGMVQALMWWRQAGDQPGRRQRARGRGRGPAADLSDMAGSAVMLNLYWAPLRSLAVVSLPLKRRPGGGWEG